MTLKRPVEKAKVTIDFGTPGIQRRELFDTHPRLRTIIR